MFVYSVRSKRVKNVVLAVAGIAAIIALLLLTRGSSLTAGGNTMRTAASTAQERQAFLEQFGWEISDDPIEVSEIIIPAEFDEVFTRYNEIQLAQNFDLSDFQGRRVKRWTYEVLNYPGYEGRRGVVQANLIIDRGVVIAGDVLSLELGGFLHGFERPAAVVAALD
ncbi:MAG: DUF4830 domain-containing protein [Oscillospiraceae bacterium]|nr:DUF4830 domain-containing protein [Oscillospiraceae bacterium]